MGTGMGVGLYLIIFVAIKFANFEGDFPKMMLASFVTVATSVVGGFMISSDLKKLLK